MIPFLKKNKSQVIFPLIFLIIVPIFGFNFLLSLMSNILLLIILVPLLIFLVALIGFSSLKSKIRTCNQCGTISLGLSDTCINCGANIGYMNKENEGNMERPGEITIEVNAEEVN